MVIIDIYYSHQSRYGWVSLCNCCNKESSTAEGRFSDAIHVTNSKVGHGHCLFELPDVAKDNILLSIMGELWQ